MHPRDDFGVRVGWTFNGCAEGCHFPGQRAESGDRKIIDVDAPHCSVSLFLEPTQNRSPATKWCLVRREPDRCRCAKPQQRRCIAPQFSIQPLVVQRLDRETVFIGKHGLSLCSNATRHRFLLRNNDVTRERAVPKIERRTRLGIAMPAADTCARMAAKASRAVVSLVREAGPHDLIQEVRIKVRNRDHVVPGVHDAGTDTDDRSHEDRLWVCDGIVQETGGVPACADHEAHEKDAHAYAHAPRGEVDARKIHGEAGGRLDCAGHEAYTNENASIPFCDPHE